MADGDNNNSKDPSHENGAKPVVVGIGATERQQVDAALRESERKLSQQKRLIDLSHDPIFVWDFDDGIVEWNRGSEELYGYSAAEAVGRRKELLLQTKVPGASFAKLREALLRDGSWAGELQHKTKDGRTLTVSARLQLEPMDDRRLVLESTRDVTERKAWEARQEMLRRELSHRVKNTLAVVQSIANQTLRHSRGREEFVKRFSARLAALSAAHDLLVQSNWKGADFAALARAQLAPYTTDNPARVRLDGPKLALPADLATSFALVLHELAVNAAKYGALSGDKGAVDLAWQVAGDGDRRFTMVWREKGGPPVKRGSRVGFGSTLIERSIQGATVHHEFAHAGVACTIELPLKEEAGVAI